MKLKTNRALPAFFVSALIAHTVLMPVSAAAADRPNFSTTNAIILTPLIIGGDLGKLDDFTLGLLSNDEVIEVNQDPLGQQASRIMQDNISQTEVWAKRMEDGSHAVGLFNCSATNAIVTANFSDLKIAGKQTVRDLWRQRDLGVFSDKFATTVPSHGVVLVRVIQKL